MKQYRRSARINRLLQEEISDIIRSRLKDPRIGDVTIIRVETTEDLRSCKVHVSTLDDAGAEDVMAGLESAAGLIRRVCPIPWRIPLGSARSRPSGY